MQLSATLISALSAILLVSAVSAAPADSDPFSTASLAGRDETEDTSLFDNLVADDIQSAALAIVAPPEDVNTTLDNELETRDSAGLRWGPVHIGNLQLTLTNPHTGFAGPKFPSANHVNFHVDKKGSRGKYDFNVVNLHIVKYGSRGKVCLYAWDSVTKKTPFDNCFDNVTKAIPKCVSAVKDFVDTLLRNADFWASIVIIAALVVALTATLGGLAVVAI